MNLDMTKLEPLLGTVVNEMGAASNGALVILGDKLGLFRALSQGAMTSAELAAEDRHARALCARVAFRTGGLRLRRLYKAETAKFSMSPEQAAVFADEDSPVFVAGGFSFLSAVYNDEPKLAEAFKSGKGLHWGEHCNCLFCGVERFFRPGYRAHLVAEWLPALDGVVEKLERGAKVADVGCGHGVIHLLMAQAFPNSEFVGIDYHDRSIAHATEAGERALKNVRFEIARAQDFSGGGLRSRHHVRRPARHGRPGRRDRAYPHGR